MSPSLSIVIPTKNRYQYLKVFLNSFVEFPDKGIELIIQDNSDIQDESFVDFLLSLNDDRIIYSYNKSWLSVVENCDIAIGSANGEFISMIGDDDGMLFDLAIESVVIAKERGLEALLFNKANYYWPDTTHAVWKDALSGNVFYSKYSGDLREVNVMEELNAVLREGAAWSLRKLPRVYHGFVSKKCLDELKLRTGSYFPGPSPDMANAIGLALITSKVFEIDAPVVISGHSKRSGGGMGGEKRHQGRLEDQKHLPRDTAELWSEKIPKFWSGATIYAESARMALEKSGSGLTINYPYLWAFCWVFEFSHRRSIMKIVVKAPSSWFNVFYYGSKIFAFRATNYLKNYFLFTGSKAHFSFEAKNIQESQNALKKLYVKIKSS